MRGIPILAILALAVVGGLGCVTSSSVTEGDRQVNTQTAGAAVEAERAIVEARQELQEGSRGWTILGLGLQAVADIKANSAQQEQVHGPAKEPKPYTAENAAAARERSTKEHESGGLGGTLLAIGGVAVGIAGTLAGMPWLAQMFPKLTGAVGKAAEVGQRIVAFTREKLEAKGMSEAARELLKTAKDENADYGIQNYQKRRADAIEEQFGMNLKVKLADTPAPVPAPVEEPIAGGPV